MARHALHPWDESTERPPAPPAAPGPAWVSAAARDWPGYFARMEGKPPRETLRSAMEKFEAEGLPDASATAPPLAIDLGCGAGTETAALLCRGWAVLAIDGHPEAFQRLVVREGVGPTPRLAMRLAMFEDLGPLPACDLLNASFSLPFCPPEHFDRVWRACLDAIRPGGRFAGQLFGDRDTWAALPDRSHFTRAEALALLGPLEIESFKEEEREGTDARDHAKHWHVFHIVAKKNA